MAARCWKFGDNISTDEILPARYMTIIDIEELGKLALSGADPDFASKVTPGDVVMGGENFGYGSSREHAPLALKGAGVSAVIAKSFARIFYRNSINLGLPVIVCAEAVDDAVEGDEVEVDMKSWTVRNLTQDKSYQFEPYPDFILDFIEKGGLIKALNDKLASEQK